MRCGQRKPPPRGVHQGGAKFCGATRASCGGALEGSLDLWRSIIDSGKAEHYFELFAFFGLAFVAATGVPTASRASRSALRRSRLFENAFVATSCSLIAFLASTWRNALRASRSAEVIGLAGSNFTRRFCHFSP